MPVTINIEGTSAQHAFAEMRQLLSGDPTFKPDTRPVAEEVPAAEEKAFPEAPKRKGRPPKAEAAPEPTEAEPTEEAPALVENDDGVGVVPEAEDKPFTPDDARKALADLLSQENGKEKAKAVFTQFGAAKLSDIPADGLKGFIAAIAKQRGL